MFFHYATRKISPILQNFNLFLKTSVCLTLGATLNNKTPFRCKILIAFAVNIGLMKFGLMI